MICSTPIDVYLELVGDESVVDIYLCLDTPSISDDGHLGGHLSEDFGRTLILGIL